MKTTKRMPGNNYLKEIIANVALKGFKYSDNGTIIPILNIGQNDYYAIDSAIKGVYGKDVSKFINEILQSGIGLTADEFCSKNIADITPGYIVEIINSTSQMIKLLYIGRLAFCVLSDECNTLYPFDILQCITLELRIGSNAYFRVIRNNQPYPDNKKLFCAKCLKKISIKYSNVTGTYSLDLKSPIETYKKVFATKTRNNPTRFSTNDLTLTKYAPYLLDMENLTYSINTEYIKKAEIKEIYKDFSMSCEIKQEKNGFKMERNGTFYFSDDFQDMIISRKAIISI